MAVMDVSRRDLMATTAAAALAGPAIDTAEASSDDPGAQPWDMTTAESRLISTALHMENVPWSDVPEISEAEAEEFIERMWAASHELEEADDEVR